MGPQFYMQEDTIFRRGELPWGMLIVNKGRVLLTDKDRFDSDQQSTQSVEVEKGGHFGVGALLAAIQEQTANTQSAVHSRSAFALTVCKLLCISLETVRDLCETYPKFFRQLRRLNEQRWSKPSEGKATQPLGLAGMKSAQSMGNAPAIVRGPTPPLGAQAAPGTGSAAMEARISRIEAECQKRSEQIDTMLAMLKKAIAVKGVAA